MGGGAGKGTGKFETPLTLRSHFSFSFRVCFPHLSPAVQIEESPRALPAGQGRAQPLPPPASSTFVKAIEALPLVEARWGSSAHRPLLGSF